jgi:prepilin-type N-terminal cleavage/methylation domain-containing protein
MPADVSRRGESRRPWGRKLLPATGFTLVELLVVIGIIGLLLAILLPALAVARAEGRAATCLSNVRQVAAAVLMYANDSRGRPPPNIGTPTPGRWWSDDDRVGPYLRRVAGGRSVLSCPSDEDGGRSYAMNVWASSKIDSYMTAAVPARGTLWPLHHPQADRLMLVVEAWSTTSPTGVEWLAEPVAGYAGLTPGQRFGAGGGVGGLVNTKRYGLANCELPFHRHRTQAAAGGTLLKPLGRVAIAYGDGHAGLRSNTILADPATGLSSLDSLWSPLDESLNR